ncbi:DNA (cytosine-5-)-methyltransferase [Durusdinium trenchii]|uniref:DNA (Cytosine-5-)-methyltransferase n=1 Tax=Durusdinium trenchii TaxID=1381693 RepID=A0ABP0NXV5_9DINO
MLAQKALLDLMLRHMDSEFDDWPDHVKKAIREVSQGHNALREKVKNEQITWRAGWPDSADRFWQLLEDTVYSADYWTAITNLVRNRRAIAEYLDAPEFRNELQQCSELFATEQKAKKQRQGDLVDGDQTAVVAAEDDEEEDPTPEEEEVQQMNHLLVEDTPTLPFKANTPASKTETMKEKLLQFKKLAVRKVHTTCKLLVEPKTENELVDLWSDSFLKDFKGNRSQLTTVKLGSVAVNKSERQLHVIYDEEAIMARRDRKGAQNVKQIETVHMLMHPDGLRIPKKSRTHFKGTNRGDVVAMVRLPDYEAETTWKIPVMDKRSLYSHHRVAVGGSCPDGRKPPSTMEPVFFHAGPWELQEEILLDFNIQAVNDLTAGVLS